MDTILIFLAVIFGLSIAGLLLENLAERSIHTVQVEQPEIVIAAIRQVLGGLS